MMINILKTKRKTLPFNGGVTKQKVFVLMLLSVFFMALVPNLYAQFTAGNLVVLQRGNGTETLASTGNSLFLKEYTTSGSAVSSVTVSNSGSSSLIQSGTAASEGYLNLSNDGKSAIFVGYNTGQPYTSSLTSSTTSTVGRGIGKVTASGVYSLAASTTSTTFFSANNIRSGTSDGNGNYWAVGANTGLSYLGTGTPAVISATSTNQRVIKAINGNFYFSTGSGTTGVWSVTSGGFPTTNSGVTEAALISDATNLTNPYDFSINTALTTAYVADATKGIVKFTKGSSWTTAYVLNSTACYGITVDYTTSPATIYATTTNNKIIKITDNGAASTATTIVDQSSNTKLSLVGLIFAPNSETLAGLTSGVATSPLTASTANQALLGFSISSIGNASVTGLKFTTSRIPATSDLTNWKLYKSSNGNYSTGTNTQVTGITITPGTSTSDITITGLSESLTDQATNNYFLVADVGSAVTSGTSALQLSLSPSNVTGTGNYNTTVTGTNYSFAGTAALTSQTVTLTPFTTPVSYGASTFNLSATATSGLTTFTYSSSNTAVATISGNTVTVVGAGTTSITATQAGNGTYASATSTGLTLTVNTAPLTITANNQSKIAGSTIATGAGSTLFTFSGLIGSDAVGSVTISSTGAGSGAAAGSYPIVPSAAVFSTGSASNYSITYANGTLTVSSPLTITPGGSAYTQNFDGISATSTASAPTGWKVDNTENTTTNFRTVSVSYSSALSNCTQIQPASGTACQSTNGIYNCVSTTTSSDRAIGFLSSSSNSRNCNWYVLLQNASSTLTIPSFTISYNIEKYRNQSNATAFTVQLYYSTDGTTWTSAGSNFLYTNTLDGNTNCPTGTNIGSLPSTSSNISGLFTPASPIPASGNVYFAWNYCVGSGTTTSNSPLLALDDVSITANTVPVISVQPSTSTASYCQNASSGVTALSVTATPGSGTISYQWFSNTSALNTGGSSIVNATNATYTPSTSTVGTLYYYCVVSNSVGLSTTSSVSGGVTITANVAPTVSITTNTGTSICAGQSVTFTPSFTNGGTSQSYLWFKNNIQVSTGSTYTDATLINNDAVKVTMTPSGGCFSPASVTSSPATTFTVTSSVTPTVSISPSTTTATCTNTNVSFTATTTSAGTSLPDWYVNGVLATSSSASFTLNKATAATYSVQAKLTSNAGGCVLTTQQVSNTTNVTVTAPNITPTVTISASSSTTVCSGNNVSFTSTVTDNGSVQPDWYVDNVLAQSNSANFTLTAPTAGSHTVQAKLTNNAGGCIVGTTQTSNIISITVNPSVPPSVVVSTPTTTFCTGSSVTFTATPTNGGVAPTYAWFKNSTLIAGQTTATYILAAPANNDVVYAVLTPSSDVCASPATATSTTVTLTINTSVPTVKVSADHVVLYAGQGCNLSAYITNGLTATAYQWTKNGVNISGQTTSNYVAVPGTDGLVNGDSLNCNITANGCTARGDSSVGMIIQTATSFTPGNLVVERISAGDTLWSRAQRIFIDEYNINGTKRQSIAMPYAIRTNPTKSNFGITASGVATSEGYMSLSSDGKTLVIPGYNALENTTGVASTTTTSGAFNNYRVIGTVDATGKAATPLADNFLGGNNIRSVASDGTRLWALGANGFYYFTDTTDLSGTQYAGTNLRTLGIFNGRLWGASASSPYIGINYFGDVSNLRDNGVLSTTLIADATLETSQLGIPSANVSPYGYTFNPTGDTLYVADDGNNNGGNGGGIFKYYYNSTTAKYSLLGKLTNIRGRSIIGDFSTTPPVLYATTVGTSCCGSAFSFTSDSIIAITDNGNLSATVALLAQASNKTIFRAIAFAPSSSQTPYIYVNQRYRGTTFNGNFGTSAIGTAANTTNNSFAFAGKFIGSGGVIVTPPVGYEISTSATFSPLYTNSSPLTITQQDLFDTSVNSVPIIYVRFRPTLSGTQNGNITLTTTNGVTQNVAVTGSGLQPTAFYYRGFGSANSTSSYTSSPTLVGGNAPSSLQLPNTTWYFNTTNSVSLQAAWVLGTNSTISIGNGTGNFILNVPNNFPISGGAGIAIGAKGTLNWYDASTPVFTNLTTGSTVNYAGSAISQTIAVATYSNLIFSGSGQRIFSNGSTYLIDNNFTVSTLNTVTTTGSTIYFDGSGTAQNVPGFTYNNLTISNPAGCTLTGNVTVNGNLFIEQGILTVSNFYSISELGNTVTVGSSGNICGIVVNGTFNNGSTAGVTCASFTIVTGSSITFPASTSVYNHKGNGGQIPKATWNAASTCLVTGITNTPPAAGGLGQTFGNFTWRNMAQTVSFTLSTNSFNTVGALTIDSTGSAGSTSLYFALVGTSASSFTNSFGSINVNNNSYFYTSFISSATNNCVANITVSGNVTVTGTAIVNLAGGSSSPTYTSVAYPTNLTIGGNLTVASTATLYAYNTAATNGVFNHGKIIFNKAGIQTYQNANLPTGYGKLDYVINSGSTVQLLSIITQRFSSSTEYDLITNNGTLNLNGFALNTTNIFGSGVISGSTTSDLYFAGTSNSSIKFDQSTPESTNALKALYVNTTGTVTVNSNLSIYDTLTPNSGTISIGSNDTITLKSISVAKTAVVGTVNATTPFTYASTGVFRVERFYPLGVRFYREIAPGVSTNGSSSIFTDWQEKGAYPTSYGIFISGGKKTSNGIIGFDPTTGFDYNYTGENNIYAYRYKSQYSKYDWDTVSSTKAETFATPFASYLTLVRGARNFNMFTIPQGGNNVLIDGPGPMQSAAIVRSVGKLGYGTYNLTINATATTPALNPADSGYTMLGNPYYCPISWNAVVNDNGFTNLYPSYWYLDPTISNGEKYVVYNGQTGTNNVPTYSNGNLQVGGSSVNNYIQPGQAFHVLTKPTNSLHPTITFKESMKAPAQAKTTVFGNQPSYSKISLTLWRPNSSNVYKLMDGAVIVFGDNLSNSLSDADSKKRDGATDNLSIFEKGTTLSIDGRLPAKPSDKITLYLGQLLDKMNYDLMVNTIDYTDLSEDPYLYDSYTNTTTALLRDTINKVSFTSFNSIAGTTGTRFSIIFKPTVLPITSISLTGSIENNKSVLNWKVIGEGNNTSYTLQSSFDGTNFATVGTVKGLGKSVSEYGLTDSYVSKTVYYRVVSNSDGKELYSNIVELSPTSISSYVSVFPNPATGGKFVLRFANISKSNYDVIVTDNFGKVVNKRLLEYNGGDVSYPMQLQEDIASGVYHVSIKDNNVPQAKTFETQLIINNK